MGGLIIDKVKRLVKRNSENFNQMCEFLNDFEKDVNSPLKIDKMYEKVEESSEMLGIEKVDEWFEIVEECLEKREEIPEKVIENLGKEQESTKKLE